MDSKAVLQAMEANPLSSIWRVSGELSLSQSSVVYHLHDLGKSIQSCQIVPHVTKILQNFWLILIILYCHIANMFEGNFWQYEQSFMFIWTNLYKSKKLN